MTSDESYKAALKYLEPYIERLHSVVQKSYDEQKSRLGDTPKIGSYPRSVLTSHLCVANAREEFEEDKNIEIKQNGHGAIVIIKSPDDYFEIDLRFKKLDDKYLTYNAKSEREVRFVNQMCLFDFMEETRTLLNLNWGYRTDFAMIPLEIWLTCPQGRRSIAWKHQVLKGGESTLSIESVTTPPQPPKETKKRIIPLLPEKQSTKQKRANERTDKS